MPDRNVRIYTADAALQTEDRLLRPESAPAARAANDTSLAQFCAFVDFYTRKAADPFSTSLACDKQAEALKLGVEEVTPENVRLLLDTMLEAIDHLEKKWLDEQLKHEDRQRRHREDVARLHARIGALQPPPRNLSACRRGVQALCSLFVREKSDSPTRRMPPVKRPRNLLPA